MLECKICGHQCKRILTKHLHTVHRISKEEYLTLYPDSLIVDPECSSRGKELASFMHTEKVKNSAREGRTRYFSSLSEEELREKASSMIAAKRTKEERVNQAKRLQSLREKMENSPEYEDYRNTRQKRMSEMVTAKWKDPAFQKLITETMSRRIVTDEERKVRSSNMKKLNELIYSNPDYRSSVCSPLWGSGSKGRRGGMRVSFISKSGIQYCFKSSWELITALKLDDASIQWSYESVSIPIINNRHYIPDFYLPDYNLLLEVKPKDLIDEVTEMKRYYAEVSGYNFLYVTEDSIGSWVDFKELEFDGETILYKEDLQRLSNCPFIKDIVE